MFKLYERKMEPFNDYSSPAAGSHENIHRAKARGWLYAALIQEVFSQSLTNPGSGIQEAQGVGAEIDGFRHGGGDGIARSCGWLVIPDCVVSVL